MAAGFESVLILSFELPTNTTLKGIVVTGTLRVKSGMRSELNFPWISAMIQFSTVFDPATYEAEWDSIVGGTPPMLGDLEVEDVEIGNPGDCPILYEQLSHVIPTDIWDASGISETAAFRVIFFYLFLGTEMIYVNIFRSDNRLISNVLMARKSAWTMMDSTTMMTNTPYSVQPEG